MSRSANRAARDAAYQAGLQAFHDGGRPPCNPHFLSSEESAWCEGWRDARDRAKAQEVEDERAAKARAVVDAIEAFTDAKIAYERRRISGPEWASVVDVNETRDHLAEVLGGPVQS